MALYNPPDPDSSATASFIRTVNEKHQLHLRNYSDLYNWSCASLDLFWNAVWDFQYPILGEKPHNNQSVDLQANPIDNPLWFSGASLNWAENMLRHAHSNSIALIQATEPMEKGIPSEPFRRISYSALYALVADLVSALLTVPIRPGDRVASYSSNCIENCAALLATIAVGGIWVGAAADFGPQGVLERLEQVQPKVLFAVDHVVYNGKTHHHLDKVAQVLSGLDHRNLLTTKVVIIESRLSKEDPPQSLPLDHQTWDAFVQTGRESQLGRTPDGQIEWQRFSFNWPIWILFSSGTTGKPKPIVHRAGGMLLQSKKELVICGDIKPDDVFFYYTTTGWMMYNWLVAGLQVGCSLVLYDGSPLRDPSLLWRWVDELKITLFGTSAKYLDALSRCFKPKDYFDLGSLRHIYSTGSPLSAALFDFVYQDIKSDVLLGSITGGSDICSLFAGMNTMLPVYRGELQCRMLGMAIEAYSAEGKPVAPNEPGELVCVRPFPCQPLGFWPLTGFGTEEEEKAAAERHKQSYFSQFEGIWYHGDHVIATESRENNGGGLIMLGRSDGVLNPGGIRFGTAELYDIIELCFSEQSAARPEFVISDCIAVGQTIQGGADERVILFVALPDGHSLSSEMEGTIKAEIRKRRSARHVPAKIIQVDEIPQTLNGKRVEVPVKKACLTLRKVHVTDLDDQIINGASIHSINPATLKNPHCLMSYALLGEKLRREVTEASGQ